MLSGRCECGQVRFEISKHDSDLGACHCSQCRRLSGHYWAAVGARMDSVRFLDDRGLAWYTSSSFAKRGFCRNCGSSLYYRLNDSDTIGVSAGSLDAPSELRLRYHIFVADKGDYYDIHDTLPQFAAAPNND